MRLRALPATAIAVTVIAVACVFDRALLHFLGWDGQTSDNYAAWSGSIPALFTLIGMSTLITGLWSHVTCHQQGCYRLGKHKVSGTPWCTRHHGNARPERTEHELLEEIGGTMAAILAELRVTR